MVTLSDAQLESLASAIQNSSEEVQDEVGMPQASNDGYGVWDSIHWGLDVTGFVPVVGDLADGINALIYLCEGNYADAGLSAVAVIPVWGTGATAAKWGKNGIKAAENIADIATDGKKVTNAVTDAAELARDSTKAVKSFPWTPKDVNGRRVY